MLDHVYITISNPFSYEVITDECFLSEFAFIPLKIHNVLTPLKNILDPAMKFSRNDIKSGVVAFACFLVYGIIVGTARQSSLLFIASITRFNIDREQASFAVVLLYATRNAFAALMAECSYSTTWYRQSQVQLTILRLYSTQK
ncbi:hypothetical protein TNCT_142222 [Trichonephila clavata]|uniref:Uncharacterized protein n=1 Tax=Trichonephila clavata TaxID=2740835 RepID=A0A8X6GPS5_TRICU|nr:hypothetical protein TNCT_142222 [Trichonephila clavata]